MATMAMAIALFGVLWPLIALATALLHVGTFALWAQFTQASVFDETVYVGILNNVSRNCFNCERKVQYFALGPH